MILCIIFCGEIYTEIKVQPERKKKIKIPALFVLSENEKEKFNNSPESGWNEDKALKGVGFGKSSAQVLLNRLQKWRSMEMTEFKNEESSPVLSK